MHQAGSALWSDVCQHINAELVDIQAWTSPVVICSNTKKSLKCTQCKDLVGRATTVTASYVAYTRMEHVRMTGCRGRRDALVRGMPSTLRVAACGEKQTGSKKIKEKETLVPVIFTPCLGAFMLAVGKALHSTIIMGTERSGRIPYCCSSRLTRHL